MRGDGRNERNNVIGGARVLGSVMGAALFAGCTMIHQPGSQPTVLLHSPLGPPRVISGGAENAPPARPTPQSAVDRSGVYGGVATGTGGAGCQRTKTVRDFRVSGDRVRWNGLRGTIAADGGLQMSSARTWIYGQFVGPVFQGMITEWGVHNFSCTFSMDLRKA